jgi:hypothetical protein
MADSIGTINEQPLHSALKDIYTSGGGSQEVLVAGYVIDVVNAPQLIEIQTQHFFAIKKKLIELIKNYPVKLVYPIASEKWLVKLPCVEGDPFVQRKSPKRGMPQQVFGELVSFPELIGHPNFVLDIALVDVEEVRCYTGKKPWRQNGWETVEQRLVRIVKVITIEKPGDLLSLVPETLPHIFTTADLQKQARLPRWLAQKAAYCLAQAGVAQRIGKRGRFNLFEITVGSQTATEVS